MMPNFLLLLMSIVVNIDCFFSFISDNEVTSRKKKSSKPFERLMEGVTFVLSGFQNPLRGDLRDKAMAMGAKYKPDWGKGCTHLV